MVVRSAEQYATIWEDLKELLLLLFSGLAVLLSLPFFFLSHLIASHPSRITCAFVQSSFPQLCYSDWLQVEASLFAGWGPLGPSVTSRICESLLLCVSPFPCAVC